MDIPTLEHLEEEQRRKIIVIGEKIFYIPEQYKAPKNDVFGHHREKNKCPRAIDYGTPAELKQYREDMMAFLENVIDPFINENAKDIAKAQEVLVKLAAEKKRVAVEMKAEAAADWNAHVTVQEQNKKQKTIK